MSRTLSIPIRQTITLPDDWQACRTPQELSYWLISQFDEFEHEVETLAADIATLRGDVDNLEDTVGNIDARLVVVEGLISNPTNGILATLAALTAADAEINAHLDDTDHNVSANAAGIAQLNTDVAAINAEIASIHDTLITYGLYINDLDARVTALENAGGGSSIDFVEAATISADYAIPAPTDAGLKNLRYYYVDDGASSYTLTIASALVTYMKANGVKTEIFADESGSGYLTLDLTAISSIMRSTSVDGKTLSSLLTDLATYAAPKKITFWGDGASLSWSAVDMTVRALAGKAKKYIHTAHFEIWAAEGIGYLGEEYAITFIDSTSTKYNTFTAFMNAYRASLGISGPSPRINIAFTSKAYSGKYAFITLYSSVSIEANALSYDPTGDTWTNLYNLAITMSIKDEQVIEL